jgi:subtilisin-like proprotein convertase family protein
MKRNLFVAVLVTVIAALAVMFVPSMISPRAQAKGPGKESVLQRKGMRVERSGWDVLLAMNAGQALPKGEFVSRQAVASGETPGAVRDLGALPEAKVGAGRSKREEREREGGEEGDFEKNLNDRVKFPTGLPGDKDPLAGLGSKLNQPNAMPTPSLTFLGQIQTESMCGCLPPDTNGDVGPNHYVQTVNTSVSVYNKTGTRLSGPVLQSAVFFSGLPAGNACRVGDDGDPIALYDPLADRWLISQFEVDSVPGHQCIAISKTGDPLGAYFAYDFVMPSSDFQDYPHLGVWPNGYYMTTNQFNQAGTAFLGAGVFAFNREKMLAGDPSANYVYHNVFANDPNAGGMLPSDFDGIVAPPIGLPNRVMEFRATEFGDPLDAIRTYEFVPDYTTPASSTFTIRTDIPLAPFDATQVNTRNLIEQGVGGIAVDGIADRLMHRLAYRNLGTFASPTNSWVGNFTVNVSGVTPTSAATYQAGVRWFELRSPDAGSLPTVRDQATQSTGDISGVAGLNNWMGGISQDNQGNIALGFSQASTTQNANIQIAGRTGAGTGGGLNEGEALFIAAMGVQTHSSGRWGDYSAMGIDPTDDCSFWYTQEYYPTTGVATWNTRIGTFKFPTCTAPQKGTLVVNVTNCATGLPVEGASITINSNLYGSTATPTGSYSGSLPPGTYTLDITKPPLYFPVNIPGVSITNGNTTTVNQCIVGSPLMQTAGSSFTAESCGPANNTVDPGETVTVNLGVKNAGAGATTNLIGTLQATGGVTSPSGPQNYGSIPPDNTTVVTRPFQFTVPAGQVCGSQVIASLQLQDGANNLGTVTFTYQVGTFGGAILNTYSTGNISTPLPDNTTVDVPIVISDLGGVADINVKVRMDHTFDGDVTISLVAPDNTIVPLIVNRGSSGDNFGSGSNDCQGTHTVFDDSAATAITAGAPPYAGSFKPESPLTAMNGKSVTGTWKVRFNDNANQDVGIIGCVQLEIMRQQPVCCGVAGTPNILASSPATVSQENCGAGSGAIDPGETVTVSLPVINNGTAATTNLTATLQTTGGVGTIWTTNPQNYGAVIPGGPAVARDFRFTASGALNCGDVITATLDLQDGATNLGTVTYNFTTGTIVTNSQTFSNSTPILIPAGQPAATSGISAPYPSTILVSGAPTTISGVTVTFSTLNHTFPDDVDVLLVSPTNRKMIIMSDAGGTNDWSGVTSITLSDAAAAPLSDTAANLAGTYKPANYDTVQDAFAAPAPAGPYLTPQTGGTDTLTSAFTGVAGGDPNGIWSLYVVDDAGQDIGNFNGGWSITLSTSSRVCCSPTAAPAFISGKVTTPDGSPLAGVTMNLSGARSAKVITDANGNYRFNNVDTDQFYTVTPSVLNYHFAPDSSSFSLLANKTDASFTAQRDALAHGNVIDTPDYFVRQHYLDFLGREPDEAGFNFWSDQIIACGADAGCAERRTINVSAAYFLSIEFMETGGLVDGLYRASYNRRAQYAEFMPDTARVANGVVVGANNWALTLAANKEAFVNAWVQRPEFQAAYGSLDNAAYVDALISHAGGFNGDRDTLVTGLNQNILTRAAALRVVAENEGFTSAKRNGMFVMMEYFGYLRRDPDEDGFNFWLNKLNQHNGNFEQAEMVKSFIVSGEYRSRFVGQ